MTLQRLTDNTHEITHRGRLYTIIERTRERGYDLFIDGGVPQRFHSIPHLMEKYPHLLSDLAVMATGGKIS